MNDWMKKQQFFGFSIIFGTVILLGFSSSNLIFAENTDEFETVSQLEFDSDEKSFVVNVFFSDRENVIYEDSKISFGRAHTHIGGPPLLHVALFDEYEGVLGCFNDWHPLWVSLNDEHSMPIENSTKASFIFPYHKDMKTFKLYDIPLNKELISVNLIYTVDAFCAKNPTDSACDNSQDSDERRSFGSLTDIMIPETLTDKNTSDSVPTIKNSSCFLSPMFKQVSLTSSAEPAKTQSPVEPGMTPLERAPITNFRIVDAFGNNLDSIGVDQQIQISADLTNGQDKGQPFTYLIQIRDDNNVTISLAWLTGTLSEGQSFSPALSWIPTQAGTYTATAFVWESINNPTALSAPVVLDINIE